jgi:hypothetical protein
MGYSLSWLAVRGKPAQVVLDELQFHPTGVREEIPESELTAVEMPNGWYLIVSQHSELVASDAAITRLSASGGEVVTCFVEEHVMFSSATRWKDGSKTWSVFHNSQERRDHLQVQGELPSEFSSIVADLKAKQQRSDAKKRRVDFIFDVPVALAQALVGYRYDRDVPGLSGAEFEVLTGSVPNNRPPPKRTPFLNVQAMKTLLIFGAVVLAAVAFLGFGFASTRRESEVSLHIFTDEGFARFRLISVMVGVVASILACFLLFRLFRLRKERIGND